MCNQCRWKARTRGGFRLQKKRHRAGLMLARCLAGASLLRSRSTCRRASRFYSAFSVALAFGQAAFWAAQPVLSQAFMPWPWPRPFPWPWPRPPLPLPLPLPWPMAQVPSPLQAPLPSPMVQVPSALQGHSALQAPLASPMAQVPSALGHSALQAPLPSPMAQVPSALGHSALQAPLASPMAQLALRQVIVASVWLQANPAAIVRAIAISNDIVFFMVSLSFFQLFCFPTISHAGICGCSHERMQQVRPRCYKTVPEKRQFFKKRQKEFFRTLVGICGRQGGAIVCLSGGIWRCFFSGIGYCVRLLPKRVGICFSVLVAVHPLGV